MIRSSSSKNESARALPVVLLVCVGAGFLVQMLQSGETAAHSRMLSVASVLAVIGVLADLQAFHAAVRGNVASAALVPYITAVVLSPSWRVVAVVVVGQLAVQLRYRRSPMKSVFNVAQIAAALSLAALVVRPVYDYGAILKGIEVVRAVGHTILPAFAALFSFQVANALGIAAIVHVVGAARFSKTLRSHLNARALFGSLVQVVLVCYSAWLAVNLGWIGAAGMLLPIVVMRQLAMTAAELTTVTEELLDLMVAAIEARDPYTSGHSKRVAATAVEIARALRLDPEKAERIQVAALLHDVGKIDEEFAQILAKEGRLTAEEWQVMKRHPVRSAELVSLVSTLRDVVPGVRHHHENWDGTGYPDGLAGTSIPLASRIIMFADTLDAITTDRPYRKALDPEEAKREFIRFRGRQFDPSICDVVVSDKVWARLYEVARTRREDVEKSSTPAVA